MIKKVINYLGFGQKSVADDTLESFLAGKSDLNAEEVEVIINSSEGDFRIVENKPQYSNGDYPNHRELVIQYNGKKFNVCGYIENNKLNMSSPIESLLSWANGKDSPYMVE